MELFENKVGRPTNEIKKKRRNFTIMIVAIVILIITVGIYSLSNLNFSNLKGASYTKGKKIYLSGAPRYISYKSKTRFGKLSGNYYIYNPSVKNGRIRVSKTAKGASIGWVLEKDIKETVNVSTPNYKKNEKIILSNTKVYSSNSIKTAKSKKSGTFYIYSSIIKNNRIRVTNKINGKIVGWVNISEIAKYQVVNEYSKYKSNPFDMQCYTEESVLANNYKKAKNVKVGDRVVCDVGFETYVEDKVKQLDYTLSYGKGMQLVKVNKYGAVSSGKNYSLTLKEPTSVGEFIGSFTFEIINTEDLSYGIKNIKFVTSDNKKYSTDDNEYKFETYPNYKGNPFQMVCYTEESILAHNYKVANNVNVGDRVVCEITFETYVDDKIKQLDYTLWYGKGLKLEKVNKYGSIVDGNKYSLTLKNPTSVGEFVGKFTFEIINTNDMSYGMENIIFETSDGRGFSTSDLMYKLK